MATELSKHIWNLKERDSDYAIKWKVLCKPPHYSNKTVKCHLCLADKYFITPPAVGEVES